MPPPAPVQYRLRSTTLAWGTACAGLGLAAGLLLGGGAGVPDFIWFILPACLWSGWEFYSSVTITTTEVVVRPSTARKVRVRVPHAQVAVEGRYVTDGRPVAWYSLPPGTLHFSYEFTAEDYEGNPGEQEVVIRYNGEQVETFLSATHWPDLRAALLALGAPRL